MNLADLVLESGRARKWLAERLGYSQAALSYICAGKRELPLAKLQPLADALDRDVVTVLAAITQTKKEAQNGQEAKTDDRAE